MVRGAWLLAAVVTLTASSPAAATTVVLVRVSGTHGARRWRAAEDRMRDELRALGMQVAEVRPPDADAMTTLLAEHAADAAVQITRSGEHAKVTVWLAGPDAAAPRRVSLAVDGREHAGVAMLRAAELVRTEIRVRAEPDPSVPTPADPAAPPSPDPTPPTVPPSPTTPTVPTPPPAAPEPPSPAPIEPTEPPKSDHVDDLATPSPESPFNRGPRQHAPVRLDSNQSPNSLAADVSPARRHGLLIDATIGGGPGVLTGLDLAGRREFARRLDIGGGVTALVSPTRRTDARGSILLGLAAARVTLTLRLPLGSRTSLHLSSGGGLALGWAHGRAISPYRGSTEARVVGVGSAALAFVVRLAPHTSVHAGAALDLLLPSIQIRSAGADLVRLGLPLIRGTLGIAWDWPLRPSRPD